jgi:sortase (surface protein transpeptidase)
VRRGSASSRASVVVAAVCAVALSACGGSDERPTRAVAVSSTVPPAAADAVRSYRAPRGYESVALPTRVRIPSIGVDGELEELGRASDGTIEVPAWHRAGWYVDGPRPGLPGPAVILGHVDSVDGPAVFARLGELRPGEEVLVDRDDGSVATFAVDRLERHPKDRFPTEAVYAPTLEAGLRLVTCGGSFDRTTGHYRENVVAFATLRS